MTKRAPRHQLQRILLQMQKQLKLRQRLLRLVGLLPREPWYRRGADRSPPTWAQRFLVQAKLRAHLNHLRRIRAGRWATLPARWK